MNSEPIIHEISSDEEGCWNEEGDASHDWIWDLLGDADSEGEGSDEVVILDDGDSCASTMQKDCVAVDAIGGRLGSDSDDDCLVLDGDPDNPVSVVDEAGNGSDDLLVVGEKGQLACRDYPHPRHLCAKFPFSTTPHAKHCNLCHCYVCDSLAPCMYWGNGVSFADHCNSTDKEDVWRTQRQNSKQRIEEGPPVQRLPDATLSMRVPLQEKGYFVLNDIFHFLNIEQTHQHSATILAQGNFDTKLNATNPLPEPVSDYILEGETQSREFVEENDMVDKYSIPEAAPQVSEADNIVEEAPAEESPVSYPPVTNNVQDPQPFPVEEPVAEPQKHTYASILRVAKGPARPSVAHLASLGSTAPLAVSDVQHVPQPAPQQQYPASSAGPERSNAEAADEITTLEEESEERSVYVRNLPSTVSAAAIEQEFKNFGRIRSGSIVIRNRKDIGVCYAFVEFEDALGVQNAIKASPIQFGGRQVHVEERRANSSSSRGGRRGRGGYQSEGARGRFGGRTFGRGGRLDGGEREYSINRQRGTGFHPRVPRQERGLLGNQNGPNPSEASA